MGDTARCLPFFCRKDVYRESFDILQPFKAFAISRSFSQLFAVSPQLFAIFRSSPQFPECVLSVYDYRADDDETMKKKKDSRPQEQGHLAFRLTGFASPALFHSSRLSVRKRRDLNPRRLAPQRFSKPSSSTSRPHFQLRKTQGRFGFLNYMSPEVNMEAEPHIRRYYTFNKVMPLFPRIFLYILTRNQTNLKHSVPYIPNRPRGGELRLSERVRKPFLINHLYGGEKEGCRRLVRNRAESALRAAPPGFPSAIRLASASAPKPLRADRSSYKLPTRR